MKKSFLALALGTLALGVAEFVTSAISSFIASDLHIMITQAGHIVSAYALGVSVGAPLIVIFARKKPLKDILLGLILLILIGNTLSTFSPNYWTLMVTRFIAGLPHGAYFGVGSIIAERLADKGKGTAAVAAMVSGMTIANLIGVPFGTFLAHSFSWRAAYAVAAIVAVFTFLCVRKWIPAMAPLPNTGLKSQFTFLKKRGPQLLILATMLGNGGILCMYAYVNPLMTDVAGFEKAELSGIMICAGLGMVLGNYISGRLSDKYSPARIAALTQGIAAVALLLIFFFASYGLICLLMVCICTACMFALSAPEQVLLLRNSRGSEMMGAACVQVAFNIGNAIGAVCGGIPIDAGYGEEYSALPGVAFAFIGFLVLGYFYKRYNNKNMPEYDGNV